MKIKRNRAAFSVNATCTVRVLATPNGWLRVVFCRFVQCGGGPGCGQNERGRNRPAADGFDSRETPHVAELLGLDHAGSSGPAAAMRYELSNLRSRMCRHPGHLLVSLAHSLMQPLKPFPRLRTVELITQVLDQRIQLSPTLHYRD